MYNFQTTRLNLFVYGIKSYYNAEWIKKEFQEVYVR